MKCDDDRIANQHFEKKCPLIILIPTWANLGVMEGCPHFPSLPVLPIIQKSCKKNYTNQFDEAKIECIVSRICLRREKKTLNLRY